MKSIKLFKYPGSKSRHIPFLKERFNSIQYDTFVEPFLGSGAVLLNIDANLKVGNDIRREIILIWEKLSEITYDDLLLFYNDIIDKFPNYSRIKHTYYDFRNSYNNMFFQTNSKEEMMFYLIVSASCLNTLF